MAAAAHTVPAGVWKLPTPKPTSKMRSCRPEARRGSGGAVRLSRSLAGVSFAQHAWSGRPQGCRQPGVFPSEHPIPVAFSVGGPHVPVTLSSPLMALPVQHWDGGHRAAQTEAPSQRKPPSPLLAFVACGLVWDQCSHALHLTHRWTRGHTRASIARACTDSGRQQPCVLPQLCIGWLCCLHPRPGARGPTAHLPAACSGYAV